MCNSSANSWFGITSLLTPLTGEFLSKSLKTIETSRRCYRSYFGFLAILNVLSSNTLAEPVRLGKSSKPP